MSGSQYDALLTRLITAASAFIESWLSRTIAVTAYTQTFNGNGGNVLFFPHRPVTAITSVQVNTTTIALASDAVSAGYAFDDTSLYLRGYTFDRGLQNVAVSYSAGLSSNAPTDVPSDLQQACIELVALKYRRLENEGVASKAMAGETTTYVVSDMPKPVQTLLMQYRNVVPA